MIVVDVEETGRRIKSLMIEKNISAIDIQKKLNLSVPYAVYKWLYGMCLPKIDHLVILADMFDVTMDDIVDDPYYLCHCDDDKTVEQNLRVALMTIGEINGVLMMANAMKEVLKA